MAESVKRLRISQESGAETNHWPVERPGEIIQRHERYSQTTTHSPKMPLTLAKQVCSCLIAVCVCGGGIMCFGVTYSNADNED